MLLLVLTLSSIAYIPAILGVIGALIGVIRVSIKLYREAKPAAVSGARKPTRQKRTFTITVSSEVK